MKRLNLDRCKKLKIFPSARTDYDPVLCTDLTFPFLEEVRFEYHAFCCQFNSLKWLNVSHTLTGRCKSSVTRSSTFKRMWKRNAVAPSPSAIQLHTSVCWSDGTIIASSPTTTATITPSLVSLMTTTGASVASSTSTTPTAAPPTCTSLVLTVTPTIAYTVQCTGTDSIMSTQVQTPIPSVTELVISSTVISSTSATPTPTPPPPCDSAECEDDEDCFLCLDEGCMPSECRKYQTCCDNEKKRRRRDIQTNETILLSSSIMNPPDCLSVKVTITPSVTISLTCFRQVSTISSLSSTPLAATPSPSATECMDDACRDCLAENCRSAQCSIYQTVCDQHISSLVCSPVVQVAVTSGTMTSTIVLPSSTPSPSSTTNSATADGVTNTPSPTCSPANVAEGNFFREADTFVVCNPVNDPFNPCTDLIDSNLLRAGMWLVIILSIGGNVIVLGFTLVYFIARYIRNKKKPHLMYFLYINLAVADLFMGIYLLTIAVVDLDTIGEYSRHAIAWQTSAGCRFAGFCALFSSLLSIYTLLVITIERVYTIKFALQRKRFHKQAVVISIVMGWILTVVMCVLPLAGLSSYERVSICLPFETRDVEDKAYVVTILIITGIASFAIMLCYAALFYFVTCNRRSLYKSMSGREELKLACRMSILVFTDFACWAPVALFGLTAAFQKPLINVTDSKILMVFVFPLNSCLNPILYSFSTRKFRSIVCTAFDHCGLCKKCNTRRMTKQNSSSNEYSTGKETSRRSTEDIIGRGPLTHHRQTQRRDTELTLISSFTPLNMMRSNGGSRRSSTLSATSDEGVIIHAPIQAGRPERSSQSSLGSENSYISEQSETSFNTSSTSSLIPLNSSSSYMKDRRFSLASLSGHISQLTSLPEEREEDLTKERHSKHMSNESLPDNRLCENTHEYTSTPPPPPPPHIEETSKGDRAGTVYANGYTSDEEGMKIEEGGQVIVTMFNEIDGTEVQETEITFQ